MTGDFSNSNIHNDGSEAFSPVRQRIFHPRPPARIVNRIREPLWVQRNWLHRGNEYTGFYRTPYGSYKGKIVCRYIGKIQFFIFDPPFCLKGHPHEPCFFPKGGGKYEVHFSKKSRTVDDGILAIEQVLIDAFERKMRKK